MVADSKAETGVLLTLVADGYHPQTFRIASCDITNTITVPDLTGGRVPIQVPHWYDFVAGVPQRVENPKDYAYFLSLTTVVTQKSEFKGKPGTARQVPMFMAGAPEITYPEKLEVHKEDKLAAFLQYLEERGMPLDAMAAVLNDGGNVSEYLEQHPTEDDLVGEL